MIHLRDMHSASLKKKNLLTYTGLHISVTFATFYWNSQAWKKIKKTKLFASRIEKGSFLLIKEKKSGSPLGLSTTTY